MASAVNRWGACALRTTFRTRPRCARTAYALQGRAFHASTSYYADKTDHSSSVETAAKVTPQKAAAPSSNSKETRHDAPLEATTGPNGANPSVGPAGALDEAAHWSRSDLAAPFEPERILSLDDAPLTAEEKAEAEAFLKDPPAKFQAILREINTSFSAIESQVEREYERIDRELERAQGEEEEDPFEDEMENRGKGPDAEEEEPPYEGDDITSLGHAQLDQHRDLRKYMRIAAWEMPQLSKLSVPYEHPTSDRPLRFRYTHYMGESHPAENKVVLEFCTADLPLSPQQRLKLVKLVGPRYNPQTDVVKMSCESFPSQAQNKRYLGDVVETLMRTARGEGNTPEAKDSFADVPVDFRHVKWKNTPQYPESWKMTPARQHALAARRGELEAAEQLRVAEDRIVDGARLIAESHQPARVPAAERVGQSMQARLDKIQRTSRNKGRPGMRLA